MKNRRFIPKKKVEEAYKRDIEILDHGIKEEEEVTDKIERLPEELFEVIGKVVSFVELADKMEEKDNENK